MRYLRPHYQLGFCALLVCLFLGARPARGQSAAPDPQPQCPGEAPGCVFCGSLLLTKTANEVAQAVCLYDDIRDRHKPGDPTTCLPKLITDLGTLKDPCDTQATKTLTLRQKIADMILTVSLQVDGFLAEVDSETAHIRAVHDSLTDRQSAATRRSSLGANAGTGGGAVGSALALGAKTATVGS
jgi:hypothetical protein